MSLTPASSSSVDSCSVSSPSLRALLLEKMKFTPPASDLEPTSATTTRYYAASPSPTIRTPLPPHAMTLKTIFAGATARAKWVGGTVTIDITDQAFTAQDLDELLEFLLKIRQDMEVPF